VVLAGADDDGVGVISGRPPVRWPLQDKAWTASFWWFPGMIIAFTAARLVLASAGIPRRRRRLFWPPPAHSLPDAPSRRATTGKPLPVAVPGQLARPADR